VHHDNSQVIPLRLKQIQDFVLVIETGSIRGAARKLGVSQPAITKSVRNLESELHAQLVKRTPHGIVPTAAGRAFFARARVAQTELRKAQEEVTQLGGEGLGSVAVGSGPLGMLLIVPEAVARFRQQFPMVSIRIVEAFSTSFLPLVRDETLDLAIGTRTADKLDPAIAFRPLFRNEFVIAARKGHPMCNARSLAQLASADWIVPLRGGPIQRAFASANIPLPRQVVYCESYSTIIALLAKTDMLAISSRAILAASFAGGLLQPIAVAESMPVYTLGMFTRIDPPLTSAAAAMAKAVTVVARSLARSIHADGR